MFCERIAFESTSSGVPPCGDAGTPSSFAQAATCFVVSLVNDASSSPLAASVRLPRWRTATSTRQHFSATGWSAGIVANASLSSSKVDGRSFHMMPPLPLALR